MDDLPRPSPVTRASIAAGSPFQHGKGLLFAAFAGTAISASTPLSPRERSGSGRLGRLTLKSHGAPTGVEHFHQTESEHFGPAIAADPGGIHQVIDGTKDIGALPGR
jgi:hypothetical protein